MPRSKLAFGLLLASSVGVPSTSRAEPKTEKSECLSAYVQAQELRRDGKLLTAHDTLLVCARSSCPEAVRNDCADWLAEVDRSLPTVVFSAKDERGVDRVDATLTVDGGSLPSAFDGRARPLDPGVHELRASLSDGRSIQQPIVVKQGERDRLVELRFVASAPPPETDRGEPTPHAPAATRPSLVAPLVLGGIAVASFAVMGAFWVDGWSGKKELDACARPCRQDDVDSVKTKLLVGNVALGVGIVAAAASALVWLFESPPAARNSAHAARGRF
jgi:hypothetical protein